MSTSKFLEDHCQIIEGCPVPKLFSEESFRSAVNYVPRTDDVFIATYPKCGTTWAQNILLLIFHQGEPMDFMKFFSATPFLEIGGAKSAESMPRPGAIKVHLPYHLTPRSSEAKYIYITRNPKDCCVSFFYHEKDLPMHSYEGTFNEYFEYFLAGNVNYGDYFDHLLGWYAHRNDPNVLFLTYEEMKEKPADTVLKIASFIDDKKYAEPLRKDQQLLNNILKYSSFDYMKETINNSMTQFVNMSPESLMNSELPEELKEMFSKLLQDKASAPEAKQSSVNFVRKGIIGDWRNHFSESQSKRMDGKFAERTKDTDIPNLWKKYM